MIACYGLLALVIGLIMVMIGYASLGFLLPRAEKRWHYAVSVYSLRACFWMVVVGLVLVVLSSLYLMGLIPSP